MKKYLTPIIMLVIFEAVGTALWLMKDNLFYLFNFSYIGFCVALGLFLFIKKYNYARRVTQLLAGLYMLVYLGLICNENMQIEGFWYCLFTGVFEAAVIHYAVAKIFGPLVFGRGWCGYCCWTAAALDFLPYSAPKKRIKIGWIRYVVFGGSLIFVAILLLAQVEKPERVSFTLIRKYLQQLINNADKQGASKSREHITSISGRLSAFSVTYFSLLAFPQYN